MQGYPMQTVAVIRTHDMQKAVDFFTAFGMTFVPEKHGKGPDHFSCEIDGRVFEIYPAKEGAPEPLSYLTFA